MDFRLDKAQSREFDVKDSRYKKLCKVRRGLLSEQPFKRRKIKSIVCFASIESSYTNRMHIWVKRKPKQECRIASANYLSLWKLILYFFSAFASMSKSLNTNSLRVESKEKRLSFKEGLSHSHATRKKLDGKVLLTSMNLLVDCLTWSRNFLWIEYLCALNAVSLWEFRAFLFLMRKAVEERKESMENVFMRKKKDQTNKTEKQFFRIIIENVFLSAQRNKSFLLARKLNKSLISFT